MDNSTLPESFICNPTIKKTIVPLPKRILLFLAFLVVSISYGQTTIDCTAGSITETFCYTNNDTTQFVYQSSTGLPLELTFNQGTTEVNFDEVIVLDTDGTTNLNINNPYGNAGDLTGFTFVSSGDTITLMIDSDGSVSCQSGSQTPWEYEVVCRTCDDPDATYEVVGTCEDVEEFSIAVDVFDLGTATSVVVSDNQGSPDQTLTEVGMISFGPYDPFTGVVITVSNADDANCVIMSEPLTFLCINEGGCAVLDAGPDVELPCEEMCVDLEAEILGIPGRDTSSYLIQGPICDIPLVTGGSPANLVIDDQWSNIITMPFGFDYYNNEYTQLVVGANGQISFNTALSGQFNDWSFEPDELIPNNGDNFPFNTIYGAYHDMDPSVTGNPNQINYFVTGDAPYRIFVLNFNTIPHFDCNNITTTQQILLYESLNIIDVNLVNKPICASWNDGLAVVGLQGNNLTEFSVPPDRNTGVWEATNENWRFVPNGDQNSMSSFAWLDETGAVIGTSPQITVCPLVDATYTAQLTTELPDGTLEILTDDVFVDRLATYSVDLGGDQQFCDVASYTIIADIDGQDPNDLTYLWSTGETTQSITVTESGTYTVETTFGTCTLIQSVTITLDESPDIELGEDIETCFEEAVILDATPTNFDPSDVTYEWSQDGVVLSGEIGPTLTVVEGGTYSVIATVGNCSSEDSIIVRPRTDLEVSLGEDFRTCANIIQTLTAATDEEGVTYQWFLNGTAIDGETGNTLEIIFDANTIGTQTYTVTITKGDCTGTTSVDVSPYDIGNCVISEGISPNNDGMNDCLDLNFLADRNAPFSLEIFNRYGTTVFEQNDYVDSFCGKDDNGTDLTTGTYYYVIKFSTPDAEFGSVKNGFTYINREVN